ncbi:hypothetical protein [Rhodopirellula europaea]|uniref:hypothetical protein n=1 Tax=Rhodopirellula europaea TaxID=1263866 RepID=UPI0011817D7E|nr:hypothetical protein [Rhodopirellula europaea]
MRTQLGLRLARSVTADDMYKHLKFIAMFIWIICLQPSIYGEEPVSVGDGSEVIHVAPGDAMSSDFSTVRGDRGPLNQHEDHGCYAELCFDSQFHEFETRLQSLPDDYYHTPPMPHRLQFQTEAIALTFDGSKNVTLPSTLAGESLSTGGFTPRFDAGFVARLQYRLSPCTFAETSWLSDVSLAGNQITPSPAGLIQLDRQGDFSSFEAIFGHDIDSMYQMPFLPTQMTGLVGVSGMWLDDSLRSFTTTSVDNDLWGLIGGIRAHTLHSHNTTTNFEVLGGIFNNNASLASVGGAIAADSLPAGSSKRQGTAFAGRVSLDCQYALKQRVFLRAGYEVHFLSGVALADTNFERNLNSSVAAIEIDNGALLHGPSFALVLVP